MAQSDALAALVEASCGGSAAAISTAALYPLEISRTRLVARTGSEFKRDTTLSVLKAIVDEGGVAALYQGLAAKCGHGIAQAFTYFYIYSFLKNAALSGAPGKTLGTLANLGVGYFAGIGNILVTSPLEVVATRMQMADGPVGVVAAVKQVLDVGGFPAFYKGMLASIVLCVNPAINLTVFDQLKAIVLKVLTKRSGKKVLALTAGQAFLVAVLAKSLATCVTYPYIRAKIIMQAATKGDGSGEATKGGSGAGKPVSRMSAVEVLRHIVRTEGVAGLFKGLQPQLFKSVLASALMLMLKERIFYYTKLFILMLARRKDVGK